MTHEETLLQGIGRIRDVRQGPDGFIYLAIDGEARDIDGPVAESLRMAAAEPVSLC